MYVLTHLFISSTYDWSLHPTSGMYPPKSKALSSPIAVRENQAPGGGMSPETGGLDQVPASEAVVHRLSPQSEL